MISATRRKLTRRVEFYQPGIMEAIPTGIMDVLPLQQYVVEPSVAERI
jgi:hypothetical protein